MFNSISKFFDANQFMPDAHKIAEKVAAIDKFENLTGVRHIGKCQTPTMNDLCFGIMRAQSDLAFRRTESNKVVIGVRVFRMINAFMECVELNHIITNQIFSIMASLEFLAIYVAAYGKSEEKEDILDLYDSVLDAEILYCDSAANVRSLVSMIDEIKHTNPINKEDKSKEN